MIFAWVQQGIHDMPEGFIWLMIFLTFPIGYVVAVAVGFVSWALSGIEQTPYHPFGDLVPSGIGFTIAGYFQWFVLLPWLWRTFVKKQSHPITRSSGP